MSGDLDMPGSLKFGVLAIALTALAPSAYAGGAEEIMRLCSQPDSQMSGGQVAFCHAFWQGVGDALHRPAAPSTTAATPASTPPAPVPSASTPPAPTPSATTPPARSTPAPSASLPPGEVLIDQGPAREIPLR